MMMGHERAMRTECNEVRHVKKDEQIEIVSATQRRERERLRSRYGDRWFGSHIQSECGRRLCRNELSFLAQSRLCWGSVQADDLVQLLLRTRRRGQRCLYNECQQTKQILDEMKKNWYRDRSYGKISRTICIFDFTFGQRTAVEESRSITMFLKKSYRHSRSDFVVRIWQRLIMIRYVLSRLKKRSRKELSSRTTESNSGRKMTHNED